IMPRENSKLKFEPLLRASAGSDTYEWEETVSTGMMGMTAFLNPPPKPFSRNRNSPVIAARITGSKPAGDGKSSPAGAAGDVNVCADMDMISNEFFFIRDKEWNGFQLDNITFVLNAIDELAGDDAFLTLRSRRPEHRTLKKVEKATEQAKQSQSSAARKAEDE